MPPGGRWRDRINHTGALLTVCGAQQGLPHDQGAYLKKQGKGLTKNVSLIYNRYIEYMNSIGC